MLSRMIVFTFPFKNVQLLSRGQEHLLVEGLERDSRVMRIELTY